MMGCGLTVRRARSAAHCPHSCAAATTTIKGVDNLLEAAQVESRIAAGATPLRIEGDFVTCSQ